MALILGIKQVTSGVGSHEGNHTSVTHQQIDVLVECSTTDGAVTELRDRIKVAKENRKKLIKMEDDLEWSNMSEKEYERKYLKYSKYIDLLKYDKMIVIEGQTLNVSDLLK